MIERLQGRLVGRGPTHLHLQIGPVRLEIPAPLSTLQHLPAEGDAVDLYTHLLWKEDGPVLFGFATQEEREFFRLLILVQGVGPRIALSVLSHMPPKDLARQIRDRSVAGLTRVPGIGTKTAGRILVELGPRVDRIWPADEAEELAPTSPVLEDAVQALAALGYAARDARKAVQAFLKTSPDAALDASVRGALRVLTQSGSA